jgi:hypothetical protein
VIGSEQRYCLKVILQILLNKSLATSKFMKNIIIAFPSIIIKRNYSNLNNVFFYDGESIYNNQNKTSCHIYDLCSHKLNVLIFL